MVRLAGFEPTTPWFVAKYSNPTELQPLKTRIVAAFLQPVQGIFKILGEPGLDVDIHIS